MRRSKHPLDQESLSAIRSLIADHGMRQLSRTLDLDPGALARAAAGEKLLKGTRALITAELGKLREAGEFPRVAGGVSGS